MGSPELAKYADFYADMTERFALTDNLSLWRDISDRLHQLTSEPEDVTYRDVTANGEPAILVMPADSSWFDMEVKNQTIDANASVDKMLSRDLLRGSSNSMLDGTGIAVTDPRINLAYADPTGLPPTMIFYGEYELLVDDAKQFAGRARAAGVDLELRSLPEGQHNFFLGAGRVPEIDAAVSEMGAWLRSKIGPAVARSERPRK